MGPLLYGRLSFSAENSPSLLNVFKNLLQILQVASCETEKVQPHSWFRVRACSLGSPPPSFFSALPSPLSTFDPKGYPAAKSADLASLVVPVRPAQRRAVDSAPRGPEGNPWEGATGSRGGCEAIHDLSGCDARPGRGCGDRRAVTRPGTQSRSARSLLAFYLQKQILQSIPLHFYCPQIAVSTQLTWNRLELDSTASIPGKGEEVMKRINTLLLILANSEALHGKSGVTGVLEEGHLAIRKFQRDVVTARHTVGYSQVNLC
ncbi:uncharacterized protein LOC130708332 isoform X4 [Balaenoptera acutorostrata]|uniref:Uncharacterized protein LOC130708332 isoform X4 n=1 Tax=Balaenoptera acutorostrata TaxID=9767 RepID=A0ABM3TNV5_BALAC|nr:uncharacterized protein LOC130708332 isoform X4 [Balaenoptera acutorostrata]